MKVRAGSLGVGRFHFSFSAGPRRARRVRSIRISAPAVESVIFHPAQKAGFFCAARPSRMTSPRVSRPRSRRHPYRPTRECRHRHRRRASRASGVSSSGGGTVQRTGCSRGGVVTPRGPEQSCRDDWRRCRVGCSCCIPLGRLGDDRALIPDLGRVSRQPALALLVFDPGHQ